MLNARTLRATGALAFLANTATFATAVAAPGDYRFEVASAQPSAAGKTDVAIRLVHAPDGKPVADAVIFESKTDMGPSGMAMPGKVTPAPAGKDGLYHFTAETGMAGKWALHLAAKVQGETDTVRGTVDYDAK